MCSLQNVFSIECVLYRIFLYKMCSLKNVFYTDCVLYNVGGALQCRGDVSFQNFACIFGQILRTTRTTASLKNVFSTEEGVLSSWVRRAQQHKKLFPR